MTLSTRTVTVLSSILFVYLLHYAQSQATPKCLYVTSITGTVSILDVQVPPSPPNNNVPLNSSVIGVLRNAGYNPTSIAAFGTQMLISSVGQVAPYSLNPLFVNNPIPPPPLANLVNLQAMTGIICLPDSMVIYKQIIFISCGIGSLVPIVQFNLLTGEYLDDGSSSYYFTETVGSMVVGYNQSITFSTSVNNPTRSTYDGDVLYMCSAGNPSYIYVYLLSDCLTFCDFTSEFYVFTSSVNHGFPAASGESWKAITLSSFDTNNIYLMRSFVVNETDFFGDLVKVDLQTGNYSGTFAESKAFGRAASVVASPFQYSFISSPQIFPTTKILPVFLENGTQYGFALPNNTIPSGMQWFDCPTFPVPVTATTSDDNTLTIVLATVLPVLAVLACSCCILLILALLGYMKYKRRERIYNVEDGDDKIMMGRRGKTKFTYREIDPEDLTIGDMLGSGAFGKVYKGEYRGAPVAIKTFDQIKLAEADEDTLIEIREEAQMMTRLCNHPNVVGFVGAVTKPGTEGHALHFSLVTEFCPNGSLYDLLYKRKEQIPQVSLIKMARDIAAGILHLHKEKVIHRDIAARNVLVGDNYAVYISDFGMARLKEQDVGTTQTNLGPIKWMAPECLVKREYSEASDAFAYGVLLWEMFTRKIPWKGKDPAAIVIAVVKQNMRMNVPKQTDPVIAKVIRSVWKKEPDRRMKMKEIVDTLDKYHKTLTGFVEGMKEDFDESDDNGDDEVFYKTNDLDSYTVPTTSATGGGTSLDTFASAMGEYKEFSEPVKKKLKKVSSSSDESEEEEEEDEEEGDEENQKFTADSYSNVDQLVASSSSSGSSQSGKKSAIVSDYSSPFGL